MKLQDQIFIVALIIVICTRWGRYAWHAAMLCLAAAGLLFLAGNLFTSQRFSWYAVGFLIFTLLKRGLQQFYFKVKISSNS